MTTPLTVPEARAILTAHERVIKQGDAWDLNEFAAWCGIVGSARDRVEQYELEGLKVELSKLEPDAGGCPAREDGTHCYCWWDGDACCSCGAGAVTTEEKVAQGME